KLQIALSNSQEISPKTTTRTLTIALADSEQVSVLPSIVSRFSKRMPKATLRVISVDTLIAKGGLAGGAADVAIGPYVPDKELLSEPLYGEEAILVVRRNHPMLKRRSRRRTDCDDLRHID